MRPTNKAVSPDFGERRRAPSARRAAPRPPCVPTGTMRVLLPLPSDAHGAIGEIERRVEVQADELGEPQAGGIEQLHDRAVAHRRERRRRAISSSCAIWSASSVPGRRACRLWVPHSSAGLLCHARARARRYLKKLRTAESRRWMLRGASPLACERAANTRTCWLSTSAPLLERLGVAVLDERRKVARVVRIGMRREAPLSAKITAERRDATRARRASCQPTGLEAWSARRRSDSAMRARNSVLMPGWKRSRSVLPSASKPSAPFSPSGTSATEPMSFASVPNSNSRCESRTWPQRGLPVANKRLEGFQARIVRGEHAQKALVRRWSSRLPMSSSTE